jgi:ADP-heptose:LPS heptosyltransferase
VLKNEEKIATGLKYFWMNYLGQDLQIRVLNFLNKTSRLRKSVSFNNYIATFKRALIILPEKPYEVILAQKCIVALKEHRPGMIVDVIAEATNKDIIKSNPYIDSAIFYSAQEFYYDHPAFKELLSVIQEKSYEACFLLKANVRPLDLLMTATSMATLRIGFTGKNISPFINLSVRPKPETLYEGDKYEALLKALGVKLLRSRIKWNIPKSTEKDVEGVLVEAGYKIEQPLIGLNISPSIGERSLPVSLLKALILELSKLSDAEIVLFYSSQKDAQINRELEGLKKNIVPILESQVSFAAAFVYKCDILISLNNLIYQLAVMLNRPVIGLFESAERDRWASCQEARFETVTGQALSGLSVEEISAKAKAILYPASA